MLMRLKSKLIELQGKFTYRQRFLQLGLIFFLIFPPTLYIILKPLNEQSYELRKGSEGLSVQKKMLETFDLSQQYIMLLVSNPHIDESQRSKIRQLEKEIDSKFKDLEEPLRYVSDVEGMNLYDTRFILHWQSFIHSIGSQDIASALTHYDLFINSLLEAIRTRGKWSLMYGSTDAASILVLQIIWNFVLPAEHWFSDIILTSKIADSSKADSLLLERQELIKNIIQRANQFLERNFYLIPQEKQNAANLEAFKNQFQKYIDNLDDFIKNYPASLKLVVENQTFDIWHAATLLENVGLNLVHAQLNYTSFMYKILIWVNVSVFLASACIIVVFVVFRVLTSHLKYLIEDAKKISQGILSCCSCSQDKDEFGQVGKAFENVSASMNSITTELHSLNSKLLESTSKIGITIKNQESKAINSKARIHEIESAINTISHDTQQLSEGMQQLCIHISQKVQSLNTQEKFKRLEANIGELGIHSKKSMVVLNGLQDKMHLLGNQINFMSKVSGNANLLSLNAAIETVHVSTNKDSFESISEKIQRFAVKTEESTKDIKHIIDDMTENVSSIKNFSLKCLEEISVGVDEFIQFTNQLSEITLKGQKQLDEFQSFKDRIEAQVSETVNTIRSISKLREVAELNSEYFAQIYIALGEFKEVSSELQDILVLIDRNK